MIEIHWIFSTPWIWEVSEHSKWISSKISTLRHQNMSGAFWPEFSRSKADHLSVDILNHRNSTSHNLIIPVIGDFNPISTRLCKSLEQSRLSFAVAKPEKTQELWQPLRESIYLPAPKNSKEKQSVSDFFWGKLKELQRRLVQQTYLREMEGRGFLG